jgi:hypothetical protein
MSLMWLKNVFYGLVLKRNHIRNIRTHKKIPLKTLYVLLCPLCFTLSLALSLSKCCRSVVQKSKTKNPTSSAGFIFDFKVGHFSLCPLCLRPSVLKSILIPEVGQKLYPHHPNFLFRIIILS